MRASRHFLTAASSKGSRRCDGTSRPTCVLSAKLRSHDLFLPACGSQNHSFLRDLAAFPPYPAQVFQLSCHVHAGHFPLLAP
jgi:hypothetical protein